MIVSTHNPKIKLVRRLLQERRAREKEQCFVVEGTRWIQELLRHQVQPEWLLATPAWQEKPTHQQLLSQCQSPTLLIDEKVFNEISDTETPAGILAVVPFPQIPLPTTLTFVLILDAITTPGNLGTILRTAYAAGVEAVLFAPGCVDRFNPKVVRATMGALLQLPCYSMTWAEIERITHAMSVLLANSNGQQSYTTFDWTKPTALIVGNEANGAGKEAHNLAHHQITIPMPTTTESLNVAIATGILLFEGVRQRHN